MDIQWPDRLCDRLISAANRDGAWGYSPDTAPSAEPTALAALALAQSGRAPDLVMRGLQWLAGRQQLDGGVAITGGASGPCWPTALALLAWLRCGPSYAEAHASNIKRAKAWLLAAHGEPVDATFYGHDGRLIGWSWTPGTHSWVEPTAYGVLALAALGDTEHPRVREGVRLLLDRSIPQGGWNYGNRCMFGSILRPLVGTSGLTLAALAGLASDPRTASGLQYLSHELPRIRAPLSLGWGLIGLQAWGIRPPLRDTWLRESAERLCRHAPTPQYDALLILAATARCPLASARPERDGNGQ